MKVWLRTKRRIGKCWRIQQRTTRWKDAPVNECGLVQFENDDHLSTYFGLGLVLVTVIGWLVYEQKLDGAALTGIAFIFAGVILLSFFSKSSAH